MRKYIKDILNSELGKVMDKIFEGNNLGQGKGGISNLTKGNITRIDLTENAVIMALVSHINGAVWK